ncbi:MAG: methyl-accepting chemotaxis protein [Rhodanobacteraceae bacterium]
MKLAALTRLRIPVFSVTARLTAVIGMLLAMLLVGAWIGLHGMSRGNDDVGRIYASGLLPLSVSDKVSRNSLRNFISLTEAAFRVDDKAIVKQKLHEVAAREKATDALVKQLQGYPFAPAVGKQLQAFTGARADVLSSVASVRDALASGDTGASELLYTGLLPSMTIMQDEMDKLIKMQVASGQRLHQEAAQRYQQIRSAALMVLVIGIALALLIATLVIRSVVVTLNRSVGVAHAIADGQLGHHIVTNGKGELGRLLAALRTMDDRLCGIVGQVTRGSDEVSVAAQQISRGNDDLSQRTQEQASSLEETASSMEEMTSTVKQNAENASHANQLARGAREQAERGGDVATRAIDAMVGIDSSSRRIADIVGLIDEIAFQTNLLSLNAAVEAARAGEQGRGFAVVASEVRNLAQRCAAAAKDIKVLIAESVEKVRTGTDLVQQTGITLVDIVDSVKKVTDIVGEIAAASQEQSAGIEQVNRAVMQMDEMTQQNAALVEQSAAASRSLEEQAADLSRQIAFFCIQLDESLPGRRVSAEVGAVLSRAAQVAPQDARPAAPSRRPASIAAARTRPGRSAVRGPVDDTVWEEF